MEAEGDKERENGHNADSSGGGVGGALLSAETFSKGKEGEG